MRTEPGADPLPVAETATVMKAEQSNTSVVFDESAVLKVFRRVPVGVNTDLELHRLLNRAGCREVPELLGWIEGAGESTFAMLTRFAAGAVQGWESATAYAASGGDFSEQAFRLGESVAEVHATLAIELGTMPLPPPGRVMNNRLNDALAYVPALRDFVPALRAAYARADDNAHAALAQRVHGDLHLGQVLRTPDSWLLLDFEGEPGRPSAERRKLDSPLRDVAGMIRSFSYAAHYPLLAELPYGQVVDDAARDWAARHAAAFCDGYAAAGGTDPREHAALLLAYVLDKAVYEAAYEANHRPRWLPVALTSLSGLLDLVGPH
jgi:maltokinase